jgi:ATP/maltotriose-dependent transcriptional regulator MalT
MRILERDRFLAQLNEYLSQAAQGRGRLLFLCAESGGGKTTVIERFAETVLPETPVAILSCDGLKMPGPFGPLFDIAEALGPEVQELLAEQAPRDQIFRAVLNALKRSTEPRVFVGEDAHWTDEATLELLRFLGRRIGNTNILFIVTYREDLLDPFHPLRRVLGDLVNEPAVARLRLPPLTLDAVRELASGTGLDPVSLHERTGGNPFYVTEIIGSGGSTIPDSIRDAVLGRAAGLSAESRALLDAASVLGVIIDPELLAAVIGAPVADLVEECMAAGMLRDFGDRIAFRHGLTRDVFLRSLSSPRRRDLHRRVLRIMEYDPVYADDLPHLAHHAEEAGDRAAVLAFAPAAARRAAAFGAHREAAAQYGRALRFARGLPEPELAALLEARSIECYLTGQIEDAIRDRARAADLRRSLGDTLKAGDNLRWLSRFSWFAGRRQEAELHARAALALLEPLPPGPELAMACSNLAQLSMLSYAFDDAIHWGNRAIALATTLNDEAIRAHAMTNVGTALLMINDADGARLIEESIAIGKANGLDDDVIRGYANLAWSALECADLASAEQMLADGFTFAIDRDLVAMELYLNAVHARLMLERGAWAEAEREAGMVASTPSANSHARIVALTVLGQLAVRRGDDPAEHLDEALALADRTGQLMRIGPARIAWAEAAWLAGDMARVRAEIAPIFPDAVETGVRWLTGRLALWLHRAGQRVADLSQLPEPFALEISGDGRAAAAYWQERGYPLDAARALAGTGEESALREALGICETLGAKPDAARIVRALREAGATSIPRGPRPSTQANPAGLTAREVEIVQLLADGQSNRAIADALFLSPRTVGHHVSAILGKLGVASRSEVRARAEALGLRPVAAQHRSSPAPK